MRRMGIGLGVGINRSNYAQGIFSAYQSRVIADGGVTEAGACVDAVSGLLLNASLLIIPSGYKSGKAYAEIPTNGNADLTWTRASTALRTNSSGLLESMGSGVPRLSYMYGSCPALLLEPQRTNLNLYSEDLGNAYWSKFQSSVTTNVTTSPDGTTNADKLIEDTSTNFHSVFINTAFSVTIGQSYTRSIYAKADGRNWISLLIIDSTQYRAFFNLSTGVVGTVSSGLTASIQSVGNGWYRCSVTRVAATTSLTSMAIELASADNTGSYTGNGTSGVFLYGAQLELGAYPTTYIPTTTASATRIADSFSRSNIYTNGLITSSGGTWFVELMGNLQYTRDAGNSNMFIGDAGNNSPSNSLEIRNGGIANSRLDLGKRISGTFTTLYSTTTSTIKIAFKWNGTSVDVFVNGTKQVSASSFSITNMEFLYSQIQDVPRFIQAMGLFTTPQTDQFCQDITTL
jgi:hypothetical protein